MSKWREYEEGTKRRPACIQDQTVIYRMALYLVKSLSFITVSWVSLLQNKSDLILVRSTTSDELTDLENLSDDQSQPRSYFS